MSAYPKKLAEIIEDIQSITDPYEKSEVLIEYADQFREVPESIATRPFPEEHRVPFCESDAYVWVRQNPDGTLKFYFAVENPQGISAKAMAAILDESLSGQPPEVVAQISPEIVLKIFGQNISMGKGQGLMGMVGMVKNLALKYVQEDSAK